MTLLIQFIFRLSFGMALAMAVTPARLVTSGYYRVHLWVLLGLNTLAGLAIFYRPGHLAESPNFALWIAVFGCAIVAAAASYAGAILWLYEKSVVGKAALMTVSMVTLAGAVLATPWGGGVPVSAVVLGLLDLMSGGLLLGVTMAAMFLGHWYLNTPTMELVPLQRLVLLMTVAVVVRSLLCAAGLSLQLSTGSLSTATLLFVALRWLSGLVGVLVLSIMAWQTLKVPNTQSATGILYVGVICTFLGELTSQLLSVNTLYPL